MARLPRHMHFKPLFWGGKRITHKRVCRSGNAPYIPQNRTDITSSSTPSLIANSGAMTSCSGVDSHFPRARRACVRTRAKTLPTFLSSLISGETSPLAKHTHTHTHTLVSCQPDRRGRGFTKTQNGYHIITVGTHYSHADSQRNWDCFFYQSNRLHLRCQGFATIDNDTATRRIVQNVSSSFICEA